MVQAEEEEYLEAAEQLLSCGRAEEALALIKSLKEEIESDTFASPKWSDLLITASMANSDVNQIKAIFEYTPEALLDHEDAALFLAQSYLENNQFHEYQILRNYWRGYEHADDAWFTFDVDKLLTEGRQHEAIQLLNSRTFSGENDAHRLLKLANLTMQNDPKEAWNYLTKATKKDPMNGQIRFCRGKLLESIGDVDAAMNEYLGSLELDPHNTALLNFIGDIYINKKAFGEAIRYYSRNLSPGGEEEPWLKFLFWKQVAKSMPSPAQPPLGNRALQQYAHYLHSLKPGEFWKEESFQQIPYAREILKTEQSAFWLRLIHACKQNKLREAWQLLHNNPFYANSWDKSLEDALKSLLIYRGLGTEDVTHETYSLAMLNVENPDDYYPLLSTLAKHSKPGLPAIETPDELDDFLQSKDAIATIFFKAGWLEAARQLYPYEHPAKHSPEWVVLDFVKVLADQLSLSKAIEYAAHLSPFARLNDFTYALLERAHDSEQEIYSLQKRAQQNSDNGLRLADFLSVIYLDHNCISEAKNIILGHKKLQQTLQGQERLARIALHQGEIAAAETIYSHIMPESVEAKSYFASKAYQEKDWPRAKALTEELLRLYPDNQTLQDNLRALSAQLI